MDACTRTWVVVKNVIDTRRTIFAALLALQPGLGFAEALVEFDGSWREQGFLRLFSNDYVQLSSSLDVVVGKQP